MLKQQNTSHKGSNRPSGAVKAAPKKTKRKASAADGPSASRASASTRSAAGSGESSNAAKIRLEHLLQLAAEFNKTLKDCLDDAEVETVHDIRTGSRRIQALVETIERDSTAKAAKELKKPAKKWLRQLKALRRAAGQVRDLDVHRKLLKDRLEDWIEHPASPVAAPNTMIVGEQPASQATDSTKSASSAGGEGNALADGSGELPISTPGATRLRGEAARLDAWLKGERHRLANGLQKQAGKRRRKVTDYEVAFMAAADRMSSPRKQVSHDSSTLAVRDFARAVRATPNLTAGNLHEFRKSVKKARYIGEADGEGWKGRQEAQAFKAIQDAVGVWHDWLCLGEEAHTVLGNNGAELNAWLGIETDRHFAQAMTTTETMRAKLMPLREEADRAAAPIARAAAPVEETAIPAEKKPPMPAHPEAAAKSSGA